MENKEVDNVESGNNMEKIFEYMILSDMMSKRKENPNKINMQDMLMLVVLKDALGSGKQTAEMLKLMQMNKGDNSGDLLKTLLLMNQQQNNNMINLHKENTARLMEMQEKEKQESEKKMKELVESLKNNNNLIPYLQSLEDRLSEVKKSNSLEELKKFLDTYKEFIDIRDQMENLLQNEKLNKAPVVDDSGKLNWQTLINKGLSVAEKVIEAKQKQPPEPKQIVPIRMTRPQKIPKSVRIKPRSPKPIKEEVKKEVEKEIDNIRMPDLKKTKKTALPQDQPKEKENKEIELSDEEVEKILSSNDKDINVV